MSFEFQNERYGTTTLNTTTHILLAEAVFRRKSLSRSGWAVAASGILPDAFIGVFLVSSAVRNVPRNKLWDVEYFREPWSTMGAISNSFVLWGLFTVVSVALVKLSTSDKVATASKLSMAFAFSGLSHVALDFLTHADDAHRHFWPVSNWRFFSPISYWDPAHHSRWLMPVEGLLVLACVVVLWRQTKSTLLRVVLGLMALMGVALIIGSLLR